MNNVALRAIVWCIASFSFFSNTVVFLLRFRSIQLSSSETRNPSSNILIMNIAACDFLMSIYLFSIARADYIYRGNYFLHAETWTSSAVCSLAGISATISCEGSLTFLLILTRHRVDPTELILARRGLVINLCNLSCWLPLIIVQFCVVLLVEIPKQLAAWLAVLFLPINSSLNPLLYTILTIDIKSIRAKNKRLMRTR
ncbi:relaxin receptor 1-like [Tubulanus polymorphus]|uniref:relaxin receptor 1-like n=1 Tax=Tubulanus polymorphus TaxID=672921 RepID=UPI003DA3CF24